MTEITLQGIDFKPSDVADDHFWNSPWQNCEKEMVARNLVKLSRYGNDDEWRPFTWQEYEGFCSHGPSYGESRIFDEFVDTGYLTFVPDEVGDYGVFSFTPKMIGVFLQYAEKE